MSAWRFPIVFGAALFGLSWAYSNRHRFVTNSEDTAQRKREGKDQADAFRRKLAEGLDEKKN